MKIRFFIATLAVAAISFGFIQKKGNDDASITDACNREDAREKCKQVLPPFRYSAMKTTHITFKPYDQVEEIAIPIYYDTQYRLVFNLEGLPQEVKVEIFDKARAFSDRKLLFESGSQKQFTFEPDPAQGLTKVYINYIVPPTKNADQAVIEKGCVVLVTGFENV